MDAVSIIIPTRNHAEFLPAALASVLEQTAKNPIQIIVVDDASEDGTGKWLRGFKAIAGAAGPRQLTPVILGRHSGTAAARNAGLKLAAGAFVGFLDADDTFEPEKISLQLRALADRDFGWCTCDVAIVEADGRRELASARYAYDDRMRAWLGPELVVANLLPVMAPLVRRELLEGLRFPEDKPLEDWFFWCDVAERGRCAYVDLALATYRKRPGGRNAARVNLRPAERPGVRPPLRLNLGAGTPGTRSWHPMPGHVNLDRSFGWRFEEGLGDFADGSVAGITISHALMYVALEDWPAVLRECARVLEPGGVLRITEDDTASPGSSRCGGWRGSEPARTLTEPAMARRLLAACGFAVFDVTADTTRFRDTSLCQAQHGEPPDVFFVEGVRECAVLFSPHSDDEALFAAFTIIRHRPRVVICFPSSGDYGDTNTRAAESFAAMSILGAPVVEQWNGHELDAKMRDLDGQLRPTVVFAPSPDASHPDHVATARAALAVFGPRVRQFHTYRDGEKVRDGNPVPFEPGWPELKREALACYRSQLEHPRARVFFEFDLAEYSAP